MFFLIPYGQTRPSILATNKDEKYHSDFARYCIGQANNYLHTQYIDKIQKNKRFYKGDQWNNQEDIDTFLKDEDNQDRNRLSIVVNNVIRPIVDQYRGNAIRMGINFRVKSVSPQAITRRETKLAEITHLSKIANQEGNPFGPAMKKKMPIGDSEAETNAIFQNVYVDHFVEDMNNLAKFVSERNKFANKQVTLAMNMAFSGIGVMHDFEYAGHQQFRVVPSETFFWDRSAKEEDLTDATFMGEVQEMFPSEIFEQWPDISQTDREAIENFSKSFSGYTANQMYGTQVNNRTSTGKIPVYKTFWSDGQFDDYGYVKDEYGYEYLTKINYKYPGEEKPRYTDKDLIQSKSERAKKLLNGKLKRRLYYDVLRMCIMIPKEILGSADKNNDQAKYTDVVLDWGIAPYQETETLEYNTVKFPYKCATWALIDGEVLSPVDDAIDPQRFINRLYSVAENQINNMGGTGPVFDKDLIGEQGESEVARAVNQSKPVFVRGRGKGVQNAVSNYDGSRALGNTMGMYNIIDAVKNSIKETTGVNDALQGSSVGNGNDQLVGVTQLMIQRGSLMQEPFYNGITLIFEQCFNAICSRGKRIYADNEREITMAVGDEGMTVIRISKDMKIEDFRCFVKRENSDETLRDSANQQLIMFKQMGMLDDKRISNLWGRSNPDQVANALRAYAKEKEEIQRMSQKDQDAEEQQMMEQAQIEQQQQQEDQYEMAAREDIKSLTDKKFEMNKEIMKNLGKVAGKNKTAENLIVQKAKNLELNNI